MMFLWRKTGVSKNRGVQFAEREREYSVVPGFCFVLFGHVSVSYSAEINDMCFVWEQKLHDFCVSARPKTSADSVHIFTITACLKYVYF